MENRKREDIPEEYRWQLEDIYKNQDEWEKDFRAGAGINSSNRSLSGPGRGSLLLLCGKSLPYLMKCSVKVIISMYIPACAAMKITLIPSTSPCLTGRKD